MNSKTQSDDPSASVPAPSVVNRCEELFGIASELPADKRETYLANACASPEERSLVDRMFEQAIHAGNYFDELAPDPQMTEVAEKPGDQIGPYKLLQAIGEGGFGVVFMAEQRKPISRRVALKIIKPGMDSREIIARFEAERQALAMMDHPHIAKVLDAGATGQGRPYFVMELVKGVPLTTFCDEQKLNTAQRLALFLQICSAVNHAHQKGIIHRDLKPSNILVTVHGDDPVPKIIDFGIAKATQQQLTDKTLFTRFEQFIGTPVYMSPEQAAVSGLDVDTRADIYSLGVLLYELLAGTPPFDSKSLRQAGYDEMRRIIREEDPPKPSTRLASLQGDERASISSSHRDDPEKIDGILRGDLDWVVMKAIEKDRSRRYETANGLAEDIKRFLRNEPVTAAAPSASYRLRKFARRNKGQLAAAAAVIVALLTGTTVSIWQAGVARREAETTKKTIAELRASAPAFLALAQAQIDRGDYKDALDTYDYYLGKLRPEDPDGQEARRDLNETMPAITKLRDAGLKFTLEAPQPTHLKLKIEGKDFDDDKISWLANAHIAELDLNDTGVSKVEGLHALPKLTRLMLGHTNIKDLEPLRGLSLTLLRVGWTDVEDLRPLIGMPLQELWVHYTHVQDLQPIVDMPLERLGLDSSKVKDLSPLEQMHQLKSVMVPLGARDFSPLRKMSGLERVSFWWTYSLPGPTLTESSFWAIHPESYVRMLEEVLRSEGELGPDVLDYFLKLGMTSLDNTELSATLIQAGVVLASATDTSRYLTLRREVLKRLNAGNEPKGEQMENLARIALMAPLEVDQAANIMRQLEQSQPDRGFPGFTLALAAFRVGQFSTSKEILSDFRPGTISHLRVKMLASVLNAVVISRLEPDKATANFAEAAEEISSFDRHDWGQIEKYEWAGHVPGPSSPQAGQGRPGSQLITLLHANNRCRSHHSSKDRQQ